MRFYPNADVDIYWEIPAEWSLYCRNPDKSWRRAPLQKKHSIAQWHDLDGIKKSKIMHKDLYIKDWPRGRIRPEACLPIYYCVGNRFIALEKAFPADFKCKPLPLNLQETRERNAYDRQQYKIKSAEEKAAKKKAKKAEELVRQRRSMRG